jgi:hypothetical protein
VRKESLEFVACGPYIKFLARMLHEGNEGQGKYGKQGWLIARRFIAIAMDQGGSIKISSQIFPEFVQAQTVFNHINNPGLIIE